MKRNKEDKILPRIGDNLSAEQMEKMLKYAKELAREKPGISMSAKELMNNTEVGNIRDYGHKRFYEIIDELAVLHSKKNRDYATPEDPLQNFRRVAKWAKEYNMITPGYEEMKIAIIYALKQIDAAFKLIRDNQSGKVEGVPDRLRDVAVYMVLSEILYEESKQGESLKSQKAGTM